MTSELIYTIIIQLATLITALLVIKKFAIKWIEDLITEPIRAMIDEVDLKGCRYHLVDFMTDIDNGITKSEIQKREAHNTYDHYTFDLGCNSYIHDEWERLKKQGKL